MFMTFELRNNNYYRPDRFGYRLPGFENAALTRDGAVANPQAAAKLAAKIEKEREARRQSQGHS
jgi:hypothetical protein